MMCCQFCHRIRVYYYRLRGARRDGDWWILGNQALRDPNSLI
jgi:hypothetical protein